MLRAGVYAEDEGYSVSLPVDFIADPYDELPNCTGICSVMFTSVYATAASEVSPASYAHCWYSESNNESVSTASVDPEKKPEELITFGNATFGTKVAMCDGILLPYLLFLCSLFPFLS